jgi:hypothetical protein
MKRLVVLVVVHDRHSLQLLAGDLRHHDQNPRHFVELREVTVQHFSECGSNEE